MKRSLILAAAVLALGGLGGFSFTTVSSASAQSAAAQVATVQSATFAVENMTCALCPVTVKKAMEQVRGVRSVKIDYAAKTATVAFDPSVTTIEAIAAASANAGYPASVKG
ncbi:cation transporter [uncultured Nisaea sp.]|uniref:heavy-metal-associated domain-containing protein n=1 Tax=uncultured Nisaea sp. TaxID=538215 RepID=UPI0030EECA9F|tara:strand:+ start:3551 stop:3883 length:333 start_codon:yes stop_codon:yes gene_type:complete